MRRSLTALLFVLLFAWPAQAQTSFTDFVPGTQTTTFWNAVIAEIEGAIDAILVRLGVLEQFEGCETLIVPTGITTADDVQVVWRARTAETIDAMSCQTNTGTASFNLQRDDGTPANIRTSAMDCTTTFTASSANLDPTEQVLALGHRIKLDVTAVSVTPPTQLTVCWGGTR